MAFGKFRTFASTYFLAIAIGFTLLYYSPSAEFKPAYDNYWLAPEGGILTPVLFFQDSGEVPFSFSAQQFQLFSPSFQSAKLDPHASEILTNIAIKTPASIRNVYYLILRINAP